MRPGTAFTAFCMLAASVTSKTRQVRPRASRPRIASSRRAVAKTLQPCSAKATHRCQPMPPSLQPVIRTVLRGGAMAG